MDDKQFEELILTLTDIGRRITQGFEQLSKVDVGNQMVLESTTFDDYSGIPMDSAHHPHNPSYKNNPKYKWFEDINMWRRIK